MSDTTPSIHNILSQHRPITKNKSDLVHDNDVSGLAGPFNLKSSKQQHTNISEGNTTAQTFDDSFTEVTQKKKSHSRRENKQIDKERIQEEKLTKKLTTNNMSSGAASSGQSQSSSKQMAFKAPRVKQPSRTSGEDDDDNITTENDNNNTFTEENDENTTSFENTQNLSKKKQQYLEQAIVDRSGAYDYANDPSNYKKARKRLQNRESAVRSRMKKRQEMEVLEEEVRKLQEQKAAVESANDELKRQNKYWEDLFAKQQLRSVVPVTVSPTPQHQHSASTNSNGFNSQSEFTDPSASVASEIGGGVSEESSYEPSFTQLKMASDKGSKRQKRQADSSFELSEMMFSHELDEQLEEATFERIEPRSTTNQAQSDSLLRQTSLDNFDKVSTLNIDDDCYLIRRPNDQHRRDLRFFGLALVFGAVGAVTSMGSSQTDVNIGGQVAFNSAQSLKSSDRLTTSESKPIKDGDDFEELTQFEVDPSSTSQNLLTALRLVLQALKTVPVFTYISFALSLLFLVMYINPLGALFSSQKSGSEAILQRVHRRRRSSKDAPQQQSASGLSSSDRRQRQSSSSSKRRSSNK